MMKDMNMNKENLPSIKDLHKLIQEQTRMILDLQTRLEKIESSGGLDYAKTIQRPRIVLKGE
jgi:hypothetical protein